MNQSKKNKITITLLAVFIFQIFLPLVFFVSLQFVKHKQNNFIKENFSSKTMFEELIFSEAEYKKLKYKNTDEIVFSTILYDIHSVKKENGKYIILVLSDEKEKKLEETGKSVSDQSDKQNTDSFSLLFTFLYHEKPSLFSFHDKNNSFYFRLAKTQDLACIYRKVISSPPDFMA